MISSVSISQSISLSMDYNDNDDNLDWPIEFLRAFFTIFNLEKDLSPAQLVVNSVKYIRNAIWTFGKLEARSLLIRYFNLSFMLVISLHISENITNSSTNAVSRSILYMLTNC